jgi:hypothetical protein
MNQTVIKSVRTNQVLQMIVSLLLLLLGFVFLIKEIQLNHVIWFYLSTGLIIFFGLYFLLDFLLYKTQKSILPGLVLCLFGFFMFLNHIHVLLFRDLLFPLFLLTFGISLFVYYLVSSEKVYLICAWILLVISGMQIFVQNGTLENVQFQKYWPISLIVIGILLLVNYRKRK